jgi:hypothetical protein
MKLKGKTRDAHYKILRHRIQGLRELLEKYTKEIEKDPNAEMPVLSVIKEINFYTAIPNRFKIK